MKKIKATLTRWRTEWKTGTALPTNFPEQTNIFKKPVNWDDAKDGPCMPLPLWRGPDNFISCWKLPLVSRIAFLFHGKIWLEIIGGGQPPVSLRTAHTIFVTTNPNAKE